MHRFWCTLIIASVYAAADSGDGVFIMTSQVGYDLGDPMRAVVRAGRPDRLSGKAAFAVVDARGTQVVDGPLRYWGEKWGAHWWIADFSSVQDEGRYRIRVSDGGMVICTSDSFPVGRSLLWRKTYPVIGFDYLKTRAARARTGKGWKDCGSDLQELSSHAVCTDALCDILEHLPKGATEAERVFLMNQLVRGCGYMAHLQDKATQLGLGDGAVVHEDRDKDVVTGNVAKAAFVFARVSRIIARHDNVESAEYLKRAKRAFAWIEQNGPIVPAGSQAFFPFVHGAPAGSRPPEGSWMTRDLVTMARAAVELFRYGEADYKARALEYAQRIMKRQVPKANAEGGLFGHFYTYDDFSSFGGIRFTEKANIHCGAWSKDGRIYNKGGHYPHYLLPLIDMLKLWPDHEDAQLWKRCLHEFAYGYLVPACSKSPFLILPAGYYRGEGLMYFGSWYHAHNNIYAFAASLALELGRLFDDERFRAIAVGNLQWIAGLNCGIREGDPGRYLPVSMISGIGGRCRGSWSKIPGSICNGFSASRQFRISEISARKDRPLFFDDEAYIAHSVPYLAALSRLRAYWADTER